MLQNALDWIECHPGLAGWIQAIGAIISIMVAMWISHSDSRRRIVEETRKNLGEIEHLHDLLSNCKTEFDRAIEGISDREKNAEYWAGTPPDLTISYYADKVSEISIDHYPITWKIAALHKVYANLINTKRHILTARSLQYHDEQDRQNLAQISEEIAGYSAECESIINAINPAIKVLRNKLQPWYKRIFRKL